MLYIDIREYAGDTLVTELWQDAWQMAEYDYYPSRMNR